LEYATQADIWSENAPADAAELTLHANALVGYKTRLARYHTDADGYPASTVIRAVFKDAVAAQARFWAANNLHPGDGELNLLSQRSVASKKIGSASIDYEEASITEKLADRDAKVRALTELCTTAYYILNNVGLLNGQPYRA
jgi:hypothetical protein